MPYVSPSPIYSHNSESGKTEEISKAYSSRRRSTIDLYIISVTSVVRNARIPIMPMKNPLNAPQVAPTPIVISKVRMGSKLKTCTQ